MTPSRMAGSVKIEIELSVLENMRQKAAEGLTPQVTFRGTDESDVLRMKDEADSIQREALYFVYGKLNQITGA